MSFLQRFASEVVSLFAESAPYLILGFLAAGLLKAWVPARAVVSKLGRDDLKSVLLASLYGIPIPLCSCSVLPTATALRRAGASRGATTSFLIATPETGVDSIGVTYALLDPLMTVLRPVIAFITAVTTGSAVNWFANEEVSDLPEPAPDDCSDGGCNDGHQHGDESFDAGDSHTFVERLRHAIQYAFGPLLDDLTPWLLVGFFLSGLIGASAPDGFFGDVVPSGFLALLLMAVLGAPLYVCATASTPIAASMIAKGLEPGAALVFLLVGPATNASTVLVVRQLLGRRVLLVYLSTLLGVALLAGALTNEVYRRSGLDLAAVVSESLHEHEGAWTWLASAVLLALMGVSAVRLRLDRRFGRALAGLLRM